jgi:DNA-binding beta-propeller fold protein YncE
VRRLLLGAVLLILACGGVATLPTPSQSTPTRTVEVAPSTPIDVTDMMGAFPTATFFVVTNEGVKAIAVLNHVVKYTIPTLGPWGTVQVAVGDNKVYVADETAGGTRLRWIDPASGTVLATRNEPGRQLVLSGPGHGALAVEPTSSRLLALYADGGRRVVEAYEAYSLQPLGKRFESLCGDRLTAGANRVVVTCLSAGELVLSDNETKPMVVSAGLGSLIASAISADGTILVGRDDGTLARIAVATTAVERIEPFRPAHLVADGIASSDPQRFAIALETTDVSLSLSEERSGRRYLSFPAKERPFGGLLAQGQFAFWSTGGQARHIDLVQGFSETMATFSVPLALPGGVGQ